jgi:hypothetical protein
VLVLLGSPTQAYENKGFIAVSAFVLSAVSCCKALQLSSSEFNGLPNVAIHSMQHGRNTVVRFPFFDADRGQVQPADVSFNQGWHATRRGDSTWRPAFCHRRTAAASGRA